jgi:hypothetical protein
MYLKGTALGKPKVLGELWPLVTPNKAKSTCCFTEHRKCIIICLQIVHKTNCKEGHKKNITVVIWKQENCLQMPLQSCKWHICIPCSQGHYFFIYIQLRSQWYIKQNPAIRTTEYQRKSIWMWNLQLAKAYLVRDCCIMPQIIIT